MLERVVKTGGRVGMDHKAARRTFLVSILGSVGGWLAGSGAAAPKAPTSTRASENRGSSAPRGPDPQQRQVIVNADDLGFSEEIDRGIFEAHDRGIVTSASLMVREPDAEAAVRHAKDRPGLSVGIHVAFDHRRRWFIDLQDLNATERELYRQLDAFVRLTGSPPTHIDSHHHVHRLFNVARLFLEAGAHYGVPVRGLTEVVYVGRFYGQPEFGRTDMTKINVGALVALLRSLGPGVSEVSCHPGHLETRSDALYNREREVELRSLVDGRARAAIAEEGLTLINYREYGRRVRAAGRGASAGCSGASIDHPPQYQHGDLRVSDGGGRAGRGRNSA